MDEIIPIIILNLAMLIIEAIYIVALSMYTLKHEKD